MSPTLLDRVLAASPAAPSGRTRLAAAVLGLGALAGLAIAAAAGGAPALWAALVSATVLVIGLAAAGGVLSAIFELTGAKWGRGYRRIAEAGAALMPLGLLGLAVLLATGHAWLPWVHADHLAGGRPHWLVRPFWDGRVLGAVLLAYAVLLRFLWWSWRRDFCVAGVPGRFGGWLGRRLARGIADPALEAIRCGRRLAVLAPVVAIVYALAFSLLGFDLVMALDPVWFSTLFGAWYFFGHLFAGLALVAVASLALRRERGALDAFVGGARQRDLATLLFAFTLVHTDFFWSQYLTIWYGNLPEETAWVIRRTVDPDQPWHRLGYPTLVAFFGLPFVALLFRRVKDARPLLGTVAVVVVAGVFLARFVEVAPAIMHGDTAPSAMLGALAGAALVLLGYLGAGWLAVRSLLAQVPILPIGDPVFAAEHDTGEAA